jgi:hypothetical protein
MLCVFLTKNEFFILKNTKVTEIYKVICATLLTSVNKKITQIE